MKTELIVFDLDDTLLDTTSLLIPIARTPAFEARIRQPLPLMPQAKDNLDYLFKKYRLMILTQGRTDAQQLKVASLGISHYFSDIFIADPAKNENKSQYFKKILELSQTPAQNIFSIGNRRATDIREAKLLGYQTCLFAYGEHQNEPIAFPEDNADFTVRHHSELISTCQL